MYTLTCLMTSHFFHLIMADQPFCANRERHQHAALQIIVPPVAPQGQEDKGRVDIGGGRQGPLVSEHRLLTERAKWAMYGDTMRSRGIEIVAVVLFAIGIILVSAASFWAAHERREVTTLVPTLLNPPAEMEIDEMWADSERAARISRHTWRTVRMAEKSAYIVLAGILPLSLAVGRVLGRKKSLAGKWALWKLRHHEWMLLVLILVGLLVGIWGYAIVKTAHAEMLEDAKFLRKLKRDGARTEEVAEEIRRRSRSNLVLVENSARGLSNTGAGVALMGASFVCFWLLTRKVAPGRP